LREGRRSCACVVIRFSDLPGETDRVDGTGHRCCARGAKRFLKTMSFTRVDDIQLAYTDTGMGLPVVLLHGYPFNRSLWTEQVGALSNSFRVITPDLRGLGESDAVSGAATMNRMAQDVAVLLDQLEISRAIVGGLSMGGYVALAFY